ncbi:MAG: Uma2 family endonuclease [Deltaproteobacteria bacterium]|nr:Uma2 family endonuclease [Deltaproteobacteria bacterium]
MVALRMQDIRRLTVDEYHRLADTGAFANERVELIEGVIVAMNPQGGGHAFATSVLSRKLGAALPESLHVRTQMPLAIAPRSEPEPDVAVVPEQLVINAAPDNPSRALLVMEVCDSSKRRDRAKEALYAAAGIPEFWIIDLPARSVEVMTQPSGTTYAHHRVVKHGSLTSKTLPAFTVRLSSLFPR